MPQSEPLFLQLTQTIKTLRSDKGCPWDKRQTTSSLVKYLKSEFDELLTAIANKDSGNLCEELGDMLYLIVMISQINSEQENFSINDVLRSIDEKLIRRHPHVFAGLTVTSDQELQEQWQKIKALEKSKKLV